MQCSGKQVAVYPDDFVPALEEPFTAGNYRVRVSALSPNDTIESVASGAFKITPMGKFEAAITP